MESQRGLRGGGQTGSCRYSPAEMINSSGMWVAGMWDAGIVVTQKEGGQGGMVGEKISIL